MSVFDEMETAGPAKEEIPPAAPCPSCGSPFAWLSVHNQIACWHCSAPPVSGFIRCRLAVVTYGERSLFAWRVHPANRWSTDGGRPGGPAPGRLGLGEGGDGEDGGLVPRVEFMRSGEMAAWFDGLPAWSPEVDEQNGRVKRLLGGSDG